MTLPAALSDAELATLDEVARALLPRAHAPYSGFSVGAAIRTAAGGVHVGVNVENAAYGSTICAERHAVGAMVVAGDDSGIVGVAIAGRGDQPLSPCGACRQVLAEVCHPQVPVRGAGDGDAAATWTVAQLLPAAFGPLRLADGAAVAGGSGASTHG